MGAELDSQKKRKGDDDDDDDDEDLILLEKYVKQGSYVSKHCISDTNQNLKQIMKQLCLFILNSKSKQHQNNIILILNILYITPIHSLKPRSFNLHIAHNITTVTTHVSTLTASLDLPYVAYTYICTYTSNNSYMDQSLKLPPILLQY